MKRSRRIVAIALCLAAIYVFLNGIGWVTVFFWKSEVIVICVTIPTTILCPAGAISVVPGSQADSPYFFIPLMAFFFFLWASVIEVVWGKLKRTPNKKLQATAKNGA